MPNSENSNGSSQSEAGSATPQNGKRHCCLYNLPRQFASQKRGTASDGLFASPREGEANKNWNIDNYPKVALPRTGVQLGTSETGLGVGMGSISLV